MDKLHIEKGDDFKTFKKLADEYDQKVAEVSAVITHVADIGKLGTRASDILKAYQAAPPAQIGAKCIEEI